MKKKIIALSRNSFFQGGIFLTASGFIASFFNYVFNILVAQALGPNSYGEISALFSYLLVTSVPLNVVATIITQKISSHDEKSFIFAQALEKWFLSKLKRVMAFSVFLIVIIPFLPRLTNLSLISSVALVLLFITSVIGIFYSSALQALHLFLASSIISVAATLIKLFGGTLAWLKLGNFNIVILFLIISQIVSFFAGLVIYKKNVNLVNLRSKPTFLPLIRKRLFQVFKSEQLIITAFSILAVTLLSNADIIIVKKFSSAFTAGIYSSWSLFAKIILYIVNPLVSLSLIFFSSKKNLHQQNNVLIISLILLVLTGIIGFFAYLFFPQLITHVIFGSRFNAVIPYITKAAIFGTFYTAIMLLNNYFLAKKSRAALILPLFIPFYLAGLFLVKSSIQNVMMLNIYFSVSIALIFLLAFLYNINQWKQKSRPTS